MLRMSSSQRSWSFQYDRVEPSGKGREEAGVAFDEINALVEQPQLVDNLSRHQGEDIRAVENMKPGTYSSEKAAPPIFG